MFFDQLFGNYLGQLSNTKHTMTTYSRNFNKLNDRLPLDAPRIETMSKQFTKDSDPGNDYEFVIQIT